MYLSADLHATQELYEHIDIKLRMYEEHMPLQNTVKLTNQLAVHLAKIYQRGFAVDLDELENVHKEFEQERGQLIRELEEQVRELMGDRPINLASTEQLSWVVYSRKPKDKKFWAELFNERMDDQDYRYQVRNSSDVLYKQRPSSVVLAMVLVRYVRQRKMVHRLHVQTNVLTVKLQVLLIQIQMPLQV